MVSYICLWFVCGAQFRRCFSRDEYNLLMKDTENRDSIEEELYSRLYIVNMCARHCPVNYARSAGWIEYTLSARAPYQICGFTCADTYEYMVAAGCATPWAARIATTKYTQTRSHKDAHARAQLVRNGIIIPIMYIYFFSYILVYSAQVVCFSWGARGCHHVFFSSGGAP